MKSTEVDSAEKTPSGLQPLSLQERQELRNCTRRAFTDFLEAAKKASLGHRAQLLIPPFSVYTRAAARPLDGKFNPTVDIATIENIEEPGRGALPIFLRELERIALKFGRAVYIESVGNEQLARHLVSQGYSRRGDEFSVSFFKTTSMLSSQLKNEI